MKDFPNEKRSSQEQESSGETTRLLYGMRRIIILAIPLLLMATCVTAVFAWLYFRKNIQTVTMIKEPNALIIGAGNAHAVRELELGNIDVSAEPRYKDVVFCVYSPNALSYNLQLSHTTNIGFQYTIYPAAKGDGGGEAEVIYLEDTFSFDEDKTLAGGYLNAKQLAEQGQIPEAQEIGAYHNATYVKLDGSGKSYDKVQINAEPLYWKSSSPLRFPENRNEEIGAYINYYVLRISWDESIVNNKETDIVYLMVEAAGSGTE